MEHLSIVVVALPGAELQSLPSVPRNTSSSGGSASAYYAE